MLATEPQTANIPGERRLWCEVLKIAAIDARNGVLSAQRFFQSKDGVFAEVCCELGLPRAKISKQVLGTIGLQQARTRGSDIAPRKSKTAPPVMKIEGNWTGDLSTIGWTQRTEQ